MAQDPVKFTFDTDFMAPAPRAVTAAPPPPPSFTSDDLAGARAAAYADGLAAGRAEAEASLAAALLAATERAGDALSGIGAHLARHDAALKADAAELGLAVARRLCAALTREAPLADMEAMVAECLADLKDEPRIIVYVSAQIIDEARPRFEAIAAAHAFPGKMIMLPADDLVPGDVRLEWAHGGITRDTRALSAAVETAVSHYTAARRRQDA